MVKTNSKVVTVNGIPHKGERAFDELLRRIDTRTANVAVIGLGYVGLPLATVFVEAGFRVVGLDLDQEKVDAVNRGESYVGDVSSELLTRVRAPSNNGTASAPLMATTDFDGLSRADIAVVCVPTPLGKTKDPDLSYIVSATNEIARRLHPGMLVVLESTTYPGTTEEVILPSLLSGADGSFEVGVDFFLAFSPERIDPGRQDWTVRSTPKVVGGMTLRCTELATAFYGTAIERTVPVSSPKVAEMVKLLENTFRATNIALVNEMAIMCDRLDVDVWEVIDAAKTKPFGFMPFFPGPGLGGHCIPVDPQYLAWKLKTMDYNARFIQLADEINFGMPAYVVGKVADSLNNRGKPLKGSTILILGVAYKADVGDVRESPAIDLIDLLEQKGALVSYHDPFVPHLEADGVDMVSVPLNGTTLKAADCVVIATAHSSLDWQWIVDNSRLVMDTRNVTNGLVSKGSQVVKL